MRILLALAALLASLPSVAETVTFAWDAVPGATGYRIWCGPATRSYGTSQITGVTGVTTASANFNPATYFCAATAFNATQQSAFSNEVTFTIAQPPLPAPPNFRFTITLADGRQIHGQLAWSEQDQGYVAVSGEIGK